MSISHATHQIDPASSLVAALYKAHEAECDRLLGQYCDKVATGSFADAQEWWAAQAPLLNTHYGVICGLFAAYQGTLQPEPFIRFCAACGVSEIKARHYAGIARNLIEPSFP